mmetsp:Transcript_15911/g.24560  ORF Transcript_15911/g.24560 Transcript_15911/m.24560 type:complete len:127 (+) Transcript_15911:1-381(+)|eukprot:CAMPEP_0170494658 /NCGR_PEP_ID=MMETSP0208-20121228/14766_1 /TAXON_ID=197538 /ORGANISM="Strombidium inclinatum, Strain S3" /LENGTH=126 /DNA_ID=CAMNT_0010770743 /DNA_START=1 /DNA_END=381 /DNA_ORIENTATION=+
MKFTALLALVSLAAAQTDPIGTLDEPYVIDDLVPVDGVYDLPFNSVVSLDDVTGVITSEFKFQPMNFYINDDGEKVYQQPRVPIGPPKEPKDPQPAETETETETTSAKTFTPPSDYCVKDPSFLDG